MKNILTVLFFFVAINLSAQESTLDKVAKETCEYLNSDDIRDLSKKDKMMKFGVFMFTKYSEYQKEFEAEGIVLDLSKGEESGREFGEKIGISMVKFCPDVLMEFANNVDPDITENAYEDDKYTIEGDIVTIKGDEFSTIVVKDHSGRLQKFLWLENFKGSEKLIGNSSIKGLNVEITYQNFECYSPQLEDYVIRKKVIAISYLDE